jgi:hypothetical protein
MRLNEIIEPDERSKTENMHEAEDQDDYIALKKCFKNKYTTFKYAYFSPTKGADEYGKNSIVGHLEYYGIKDKDEDKDLVAEVSIKFEDLEKDGLEKIEFGNEYVVVPKMGGKEAVMSDAATLVDEFNKIADEKKLLKTTIPLPIKGSKDVLPADKPYHWVGAGGWVYKNGNTYYYLSLSKGGWIRTQEELEGYLKTKNSCAAKPQQGENLGGGRKRRRKTKRKRTKRRKTKRKRSRRKRTMKRKKRRGKKRRGKTRRRR